MPVLPEAEFGVVGGLVDVGLDVGVAGVDKLLLHPEKVVSLGQTSKLTNQDTYG